MTAYPELPKAKEEEKQDFKEKMNEWNMNIGLKKTSKDGVSNQNIGKGTGKDKEKVKTIQEKKEEFKSEDDYLVKENNYGTVLSDFIFVTTVSKKKKKNKI